MFGGSAGRAASIAARDVDDMLAAVASRNRHGFRRAGRRIGPVGRCDMRGIAMGPVPGHIIGVGVMDIR